MKCKGCKEDFNKSEMTNARNEHGEYPKSSKIYYCKECEEQVYQRKVLVEYLHRWFIYKGYYNESKSEENLAEKNRLMGLVNTQISNLAKDSYTYEQIRLILDYILVIEKVEFTETILGLVPYNYLKVSKYHKKRFRVQQSKSYGYIAPVGERLKTPAHKPDRNALKLTKMEMV